MPSTQQEALATKSLSDQRDPWRGYLLYGDFIGGSLTQRIHDSWPGCMVLFRPGKILGIFSAHPGLVQVARRNTEMHLLALFQKRAATDGAPLLSA